MALDVVNEHIINAHKATAYFPSSQGKPAHVSKVVRLMTRGTMCRDGVTRRLDGAKAGSSWITSLEAIQRFTDAVTAAELGSARQAPPRASNHVRRESERAAREMEMAGA